MHKQFWRSARSMQMLARNASKRSQSRSLCRRCQFDLDYRAQLYRCSCDGKLRVEAVGRASSRCHDLHAKPESIGIHFCYFSAVCGAGIRPRLASSDRDRYFVNCYAAGFLWLPDPRCWELSGLSHVEPDADDDCRTQRRLLFLLVAAIATWQEGCEMVQLGG
jgi:hypothetical protein